jgi:hypothetical protein
MVVSFAGGRQCNAACVAERVRCCTHSRRHRMRRRISKPATECLQQFLEEGFVAASGSYENLYGRQL